MKVRFLASLAVVSVVTLVLSDARLNGQAPAPAPGSAAAHIRAAQAAAKQDWAWMYTRLCSEQLPNINKNLPAPTPPAVPPGPPARERWHAEPMKVFDNVYWLGQTEFSAWAINTSQGIILMDAIFDYSIQDEVIDGLKKVGLNPAGIKYAIMGHWHGDHAGGAKKLQELYGTKIIMGPGDWDNLEKQAPAYKIPRDVVATDGMKVTLGNETVTVYNTPGHTQGTLSSIIPVTDGGKPHTVAYWGGTMFNWVGRTVNGTGEYVGKPESYWFEQYARNAARFKDIAAKAGADIILSNHTDFDASKVKMPLMGLRKPGDAFHPYIVGEDSVQRYLTVVGECAKAGEILAKQ